MNVPKLKFKADDGTEFPKWEEKKLGEVFEERSERSTDNLDLLSVTIANGVIRQNESDKRNVSSVDKSNYKRVYVGDLAYNSMRMWQGAEGVSAYDGIVSPAYTVLVPKKQEYAYFYEYMFKRTEMLHIFQRYSQGLTSDTWNLKYPVLSRISVVVPSLPEQKKIAAFLSTIDDIITTTEAELTAWEKRKKGVMQKIFNREVRFKADDGSEFPEWEEAEIGKVGTFIKGAALSKADISDTGTPFVLYGELYTTYKEIAYTIKRKTEAVVDEKYYSKIGDVVIPTSGESPEEISTATCIMVPNVILAGDLNIFRSSIIDGRIMSYILNYQAKNKIATIAQGKSIVHIQAKELSKIKIKFPIDANEQCKISDCLSSLDDVINQIQAELSAWKEFKKGLLQRMFV